MHLLGDDGDDHVLLEKSSGGIDQLTYTYHDKMVLRQFEAAGLEAKLFSKFSQEKSSTFAYLLLEVQIVLRRSTSSNLKCTKVCYDSLPVCHFYFSKSQH